MMATIALVAPLAQAQMPPNRCPDGDNFQHATEVARDQGILQTRVWRDEGNRCHFKITAHGRVIASGADANVELLPEMYVVRIDSNDVVLEGYSGGAHCCWTYWIVTALPQPHVAAEIHSAQPIAFLDPRGIELHDLVTRDGAFDYFDGLCHACTAMPQVFLRFVRGRLTDANRAYRAEYDREIEEARAELTPAQVAEFRSQTASPPYTNENEEIAAPILRIVLAYLYSGREQQAWQALQEMWPPADQQRIKQKIAETRGKGILNAANPAR